ncbi:anti-sigma factor antagonist [Rhodococcus sp. Eu-32]|uniref:STAS domain-containing protein n=1 Tax=Rhodococcus sp. Eu-32 TaxID=1017319 RepID=UPI000DF4C71D|nr:STAS domain-containing protein [Rhodococcus sp. Eu-32]RRQ29175.1 anti-sigma factor antagonist [Rhodococcus sp. Eu-32]
MTIDNAQPSSLVVLVTRKGSTTVVSVRGVVDLQTAPQLTESIDAVLAENVPTTLIVDLTDVSFLASVGMTVLIEVSRRVADTANFAVVADGPSTKRPMTLMGIDQMITVYTDLDAALAAVPSSGE